MKAAQTAEEQPIDEVDEMLGQAARLFIKLAARAFSILIYRV